MVLLLNEISLLWKIYPVLIIQKVELIMEVNNLHRKEIVIDRVIEGSIAEEAGIESGDVLLKINDTEVKDIIEYKYLISDEFLNILIRKPNGEEWEIEIEKEFDEDLGIEFEDPIIDGAKRCHNKCIFCFIDQLPKGMRETLYFKDDDSRLSFLQGNFVTLTNMSDDDINRIIRYRISPINVSVHTTNPELRIKMLNNKKAGNIMESLKKLTDAGISINCQIVLCPGINDGDELKRTLNDLFSFYPLISNVAIVPVGITRYRKNLFKMEGYDKETSKEAIKLVSKLQKEFVDKTGEPFARLADEFYLLAGEEVPTYEHYGDFEQLEDGIGMIRFFERCVEESLEDNEIDGKGMPIAFFTGEASYEFIKYMAEKINKKLNVAINVYKIINNFFGGKITVTGLITGKDIIEQTKDKLKEKIVFIPVNMLKAHTDILLDDITIEDLETKLNVKIVKCKYTGEDLIDKIIDEVIKWQNQ
jgi:putative radical SAM enzyme (TIGR03279 family)